MIKLIRNNLPIISLMVLAVIIDLIAIFNFGTYTFDDLFAIHFSKMDLSKLLPFLTNDVNPSLYFIALHFWTKIFGAGEIISRILALLFSVLSIPLFYYLGKRILNGWIAILASLFLVLSYFQIFTASQVRMYSMLMFFGLWSLVIFWKIIAEDKKNLWGVYIIVSLVMLFSNLGGIFGLLIQWLWLAIFIIKKQINKKLLKKYILSQLPIIIIWLTWIILFFLPKLDEIIYLGWYFNENINREFWFGIYSYFFLLLKNYWLRLFTGVIIFAAPFMIVIWSDKKMVQKINKRINPNWFLFTWILPALAVSIIAQINYARIFIISYLGFYLIVAYLFFFIFQAQKKVFWLIFSLWLIISVVNLNNLKTNIVAWDQANDWLIKNQQANDKILTYGFFNELPFSYYYRGDAPHQGLYLEEDNKNLEQRIIEKNWQNVINENNINNLEKLTTNFDRILIVGESPNEKIILDSLIKKWFAENNWSITQAFRPNSLLGPAIMVLDRK